MGTTDCHSCSLWYHSISGSSCDLSFTLSILFSSNSAGLPDCLTRSSTKRSPLPVAAEASRMRQTRSTPSNASWTAVIMRRLSSYPGLCTPGVSTRTICPSGRVTIPRILKRVVWGLLETAAIFSPTSRLSRVDLPALGRPIKATWPARWLARLFVWFGDIRWNDNFFGRDDDDFTIFPGRDGIAEAFVH